MMIVDLVDEVDFKEKMLEIGAPIDMTDNLDEVASKLNDWLKSEPHKIDSVKSVCAEIEATGATILPDVSSLMNRLLAL